MDSWYFAYGSNLLQQQMIARVGSLGGPDSRRLAILANYQLVFQHLDAGSPAYANIVSPGPGVEGVLYYLSAAAFETLDVYEDGYDRQPVTVTDNQGQTLTAIAYIMKPTEQLKPGRPQPEYLQRIVSGATQHGLTSQYIKSIEDAARAL